MIKQIAAIVAAAGCAALIVSIVPEVAVGSSQNAGIPVADAGIPARIDSRTQHKITCTQGWPYYEKSLPARRSRVGRQSAGGAHDRHRPLNQERQVANA